MGSLEALPRLEAASRQFFTVLLLVLDSRGSVLVLVSRVTVLVLVSTLEGHCLGLDLGLRGTVLY